MDKISTDDLWGGRRSRPKAAPQRSREVYYEPQPERRKRPVQQNGTTKQKSNRMASTEQAGKVRRHSPAGFSGWCKKWWRKTKRILFDHDQAFDMPLMVTVLLLLGIGLITVYSASYAYAYTNRGGDSTYYIMHQLVYAAIGVVLMLFVSAQDPKKLDGKFMLALLGVTYVLLIIVRILPAVKGVHRWINLGFITFQPSEIAKFAAILYCASYISANYKQMNVVDYKNAATYEKSHKNRITKWWYDMRYNFVHAVVPFIFGLGLMLILVVVEPHLSCTVLLVLIIGTQMYVGGTNRFYFATLFGLAFAAALVLIYTDFIPYGKTRIEVWKDPFYDKLGDGWQNIQSLYAISSGGLFGVGIGNSRQKYLYISEPQNDFIFAVVCEEVGLVGAMFIILLFMAFVLRGFALSLAHPNRFCKMVGIGISSQIGFQMLLNVCVVTNIVPNTGISLPFFSSGGTSLVMLLMEIGVLLGISRTSPNKLI